VGFPVWPYSGQDFSLIATGERSSGRDVSGRHTRNRAEPQRSARAEDARGTEQSHRGGMAMERKELAGELTMEEARPRRGFAGGRCATRAHGAEDAGRKR
jgi:hypothetical protein